MYDVAVIGAGMAGQVCANYLARAGKSVVLIEQNHQGGGNMSGFRREGYYFDGGDQSFESLGIVFPILDELGLYDPDDWVKADFRMISDDFDFRIDSLEHVEQILQESFPDEPGIKPLFDEIRQVSQFLDRQYNPEDIPLLNDFRISRVLALTPWLAKIRKWLTFDYRVKACSVIQNPALRNWFTYIGYYRMPYLFFAGFWHIWATDYWYPKGGMQAFHKRLTDSFTAHGGTALFKTSAENIVVRGGKATGVTITAGNCDTDVIEAETLVYAGDYKRLITDLLPEGTFPRKRVKRVLDGKLTESLVNVYLGVDISGDELARQMGAHHAFYFPNYDVIFPDGRSPKDVHERMWVTLNYFGNESTGLAPEGKSNLVVQTYSPYEWENYWHNGSDSTYRTAEYREFKREVGMQLVSTAENVVPGLGEKIEYFDVGTPLSSNRFSRNTIGSSGGWCYDDKESVVYRTGRFNMIRTPISNLLAAGHYTVWPGGVISAALSGRMVANVLLGKPLLARMNRTR